MATTESGRTAETFQANYTFPTCLHSFQSRQAVQNALLQLRSLDVRTQVRTSQTVTALLALLSAPMPKAGDDLSHEKQQAAKSNETQQRHIFLHCARAKLEIGSCLSPKRVVPVYCMGYLVLVRCEIDNSRPQKQASKSSRIPNAHTTMSCIVYLDTNALIFRQSRLHRLLR